MSKFVGLLGRKPESGNADQPSIQQTTVAPQPPVAEKPVMAPPAADPAPPAADPPPPAADSPPPKPDVDLDEDLFVPVAAKLGEENEAVRALLRDAEHKIGELDAIKLSIARLLDPVASALRSYEEAKSEKLILQRALGDAQAVCATLRDELTAVQQKAVAFKAEYARLQETSAAANRNVAALERNNAKQLAELADRRARLAELQNLSLRQASDLQSARSENLRIGEHAAAADQQIVQLEAEIQKTQQQAQQIKHERAAVQASLDKTLNELAQTARGLSDSEKARISLQARLEVVERNLADLQAERAQLAATLDETVHQHREKLNVLGSRLETVQARSNLTENLLDEARRALASRADEIRALERRLMEASTVQSVTAEKLGAAETALADREARISALEEEHAALSEHGRKLIEIANEREAGLRRAQQRLGEQSEILKRLQDELEATRSSRAGKIDDLKAQLQREQLDRAMAEGALEGARKETARLLAEIGALRARQVVPGAAEPSAAQDVLKRAA